MRKILVIILFLTTFAFTQEDMWVKIYPDTITDGYWWYFGNGLFELDDGFLIVGSFMEADDDGIETGFFIMKTDEDGDAIWTKKYNMYMSYPEIFCPIETPDGNFALFVYSTLFKFNNEGDSLLMRTYEDVICAGITLINTDDNGFIFSGLSPENLGSLLVIRTDSSGNIEAIKSFQTYIMPWGSYNYSTYLKQTSDGGFLMANGALLYKFDSDLDTLWSYCYDYWYYGIMDFTESADSNYLIVGDPAGIMKVSHFTGDVLRYEPYYLGDIGDFTALGTIKKTSDDNFILAGSSAPHSYWFDGVSYLIRLDSLWNELWVQEISDPSINRICWLKKIIQLPDSSYLAVGTATVPEDTYHVCLVNLHRRDTKVMLEQKPEKLFIISIFPNPFNSSCAITAPSEAAIEIFDLNGKCVEAGLAPAQHQGDRKSRPYIWRPDESITSGVYLIRATKGGETITKRAVLMK